MSDFSLRTDYLAATSQFISPEERGTAVTRLFEAGANLRELALHMGWSLPYAATMLQTYAALNPDSSNAILVKLYEAEKRGEL